MLRTKMPGKDNKWWHSKHMGVVLQYNVRFLANLIQKKCCIFCNCGKKGQSTRNWDNLDEMAFLA